jgi:hypothetical protein
VTEMISLALTLEPEEAAEPLLGRLRHKLAQHVLPARRLRINRREVKQIYNTYKPKKRQVGASTCALCAWGSVSRFCRPA